MTSLNFLKKYWWRLVLFILLSAGYAHFYENKAVVHLQVGVKSSTTFALSWAADGEPFSGEKSRQITIFPRVRHYSLRIGDLENIDKLRIRPLNEKGKIRIILLRVRQKGFEPINVRSVSEMQQFVPKSGIEETWVDKDGLWVVSYNSKPRLDLNIDPQPKPNESKRLYAIYLLFFIACFLPYQRLPVQGFGYVPYLMMLVGALIFTMATLSRYNKHPDEYVHYYAAKYYETSFLPPAICAPGTENTYSTYGVSRLNSYETAHFFAGKFASVLGFLPGDDYRKVRYFNVFLWFLLTAVAFVAVQSRILFIPLLISPQIWYLFSYFNSEAFALFSLFIFSYLVVDERSPLRRYLNGAMSRWRQLLAGIAFGVFVAIILLLKMNFYFYIIFMMLWGVIVFFTSDVRPSKIQLRKVAVIAVTAVCIVAGRVAWDQTVNAFEKRERKVACQEKMAEPIYKPSTPLHEQATELRLKQRGASLADFLFNHNYLSIMSRSATGAYGYLEYFAQWPYYRLMLFLLGIFLAMGVSYSFYGTSLEVKLLALALMACSVMIAVAAAWMSWTSVFQPQGRYLFPVLPMIGIMLHRIRERIHAGALTLVVGLLFVASIYSFLWIGLNSIPKI
jgi:hypothetical protein